MVRVSPTRSIPVPAPQGNDPNGGSIGRVGSVQVLITVTGKSQRCACSQAHTKAFRLSFEPSTPTTIGSALVMIPPRGPSLGAVAATLAAMSPSASQPADGAVHALWSRTAWSLVSLRREITEVIVDELPPNRADREPPRLRPCTARRWRGARDDPHQPVHQRPVSPVR